MFSEGINLLIYEDRRDDKNLFYNWESIYHFMRNSWKLIITFDKNFNMNAFIKKMSYLQKKTDSQIHISDFWKIAPPPPKIAWAD